MRLRELEVDVSDANDDVAALWFEGPGSGFAGQVSSLRRLAVLPRLRVRRLLLRQLRAVHRKHVDGFFVDGAG